MGDGVLFDLAPALRAGLEASGASVQEQPWFGFGLSTPGVRDWRKLWPALVASVKPDVVVAFVGPWDLRPVTVAGVGPALVPGTDAWARWYTVQADAAVTALSSSGARVVWLGPTPEAAPGTAGAVSAMASVLERVAQDRGATFVDARAALGSSFRPLIAIMGDPLIRLYKPDGEHLCPEGAARLARIVLGPVAAVAPRRLYVNDSWVEGTWRSDPRYTVSAGIGGAC